MAKSRAQRKAEKRAREEAARAARDAESQAQHDTQVPKSGDIAEIEAVEAGIAWDDPGIGIDWPIQEPLLSGRDRSAPRLSEVAGSLPF